MEAVKDAPILICYDGSDTAGAAIGAAAALFPGRRAVVLDVSPLVRSDRTSSEAVQDIDKARLGDAQSVAEAGAALAREAGLDAEARASLETATWRGVAEVADDVDAAAIVLGAHNRTGPLEPPHPSLADEVLAHTGRPVVVVPPPA